MAAFGPQTSVFEASPMLRLWLEGIDAHKCRRLSACSSAPADQRRTSGSPVVAENSVPIEIVALTEFGC